MNPIANNQVLTVEDMAEHIKATAKKYADLHSLFETVQLFYRQIRGSSTVDEQAYQDKLLVINGLVYNQGKLSKKVISCV